MVRLRLGGELLPLGRLLGVVVLIKTVETRTGVGAPEAAQVYGVEPPGGAFNINRREKRV